MNKNPSQEMSSLMDKVDLNRDEILEKKPKSGEYTHEMVEANADDGEITQKVGSLEIDKDLPETEIDKVP